MQTGIERQKNGTAYAGVLAFAAILSGSSVSAGPDCLPVGQVTKHAILTNTLIEFTLKAQQDSEPTRLFMEVGAACPQLAFHNYFYYVALDGELCAGRDQIQARSGERCDILALRTETVILSEAPELLEDAVITTPTKSGPR